MSSSAREAMFSTPSYASQPTARTASWQLLVAQQADWAKRFIERPEPVHLVTLAGSLPAAIEQQHCVDLERLLACVAQLLQQAQAGTHLTVIGDEAFIWQVTVVAQQAGLLADEISQIKAGEQRRLFCTHCAHLQLIEDQAHTTCAQCGVRLLVRRHFSRRLGAYQGVCLNPDQPYAEVPL